jgi:hypothetical protein
MRIVKRLTNERINTGRIARAEWLRRMTRTQSKVPSEWTIRKGMAL